MLSKEKISQYKKKLEEECLKLINEIKAEEKPVSFGSDVEDDSEEADEFEEYSTNISIAQVKKRKLEEVKHALEKIGKGTYGTCDKCGGEISENVFEAAPESDLCSMCKKTN